MSPEQSAALQARLAENDMTALVAAVDIQGILGVLKTRVPLLDGNGDPVVAWQDIPNSNIHGFLLATLEWAIIEFVSGGEFFGAMNALDDATKLQLRVLCRSFLSLITQRQTVEMTDPMKREAAIGALAMLSYVGLITPTSEETILAMGQVAATTSWEDENFVVSEANVLTALGISQTVQEG